MNRRPPSVEPVNQPDFARFVDDILVGLYDFDLMRHDVILCSAHSLSMLLSCVLWCTYLQGIKPEFEMIV